MTDGRIAADARTRIDAFVLHASTITRTVGADGALRVASGTGASGRRAKEAGNAFADGSAGG